MSATRASVESTGWQAMKTRRSRSSPTVVVERRVEIGRPARAPRARGRAPRACARASSLPAQLVDGAVLARWPSARRPGCRARPTRGHCSSAATSASCASSSARPTSRTMRARPAISLADSIRQTASIARWASDAGTRTDLSSIRRADAARAPARRAQLLASACARRRSSASRSSGVIASPKSSASKTWRISISDSPCHRVGAALDPLDRLLASTSPGSSSSRRQLLGLGERAVDDGPLAAVEA